MLDVPQARSRGVSLPGNMDIGADDIYREEESPFEMLQIRQIRNLTARFELHLLKLQSPSK